MTTISVIIPVYNGAATILATVDSVLAQTYPDFEIIIINDGSTDKTLELLSSITDRRVKIFSYPNGGLSIARNRGISLAKGDFIAFLDADDRWTSDKLALQLAALQQHSTAALAYSWVYFQYENVAESYADTSNYFTGNVYPELLLKNFLHNGSNPLIRKKTIDQIGLFDPNLKACEDWDFYLRIAAKYDFILVPKVQIIYRQSSTSMTGNIEQMEYYLKLVIERNFALAPDKLQYLKKQSLGWTHKYLAQQYLKYKINEIKGRKLAFLNLGKAIYYYPPNIFESFTQALARMLLKAITAGCISI
jgi:glycosyltransferase involved in cell wall biosynthesis